MKRHPLQTYCQPDLSDFVVHFTQRTGRPKMDDVPLIIREMAGRDRLAGILRERCIYPFRVFQSGVDPATAVCFTECTRAGITKLICQGRYAAIGIAFTKEFVFEQGGGPAFYVRGDEWVSLVGALPPELRGRATRFWPGADTDDDWERLPKCLETRSEWTHEREWRVPTGVGFSFELTDIAFLILPDERHSLRGIPVVTIDERTGAISDPARVWIRS